MLRKAFKFISDMIKTGTAKPAVLTVEDINASYNAALEAGSVQDMQSIWERTNDDRKLRADMAAITAQHFQNYAESDNPSRIGKMANLMEFMSDKRMTLPPTLLNEGDVEDAYIEALKSGNFADADRLFKYTEADLWLRNGIAGKVADLYTDNVQHERFGKNQAMIKYLADNPRALSIVPDVMSTLHLNALSEHDDLAATMIRHDSAHNPKLQEELAGQHDFEMLIRSERAESAGYAHLTGVEADIAAAQHMFTRDTGMNASALGDMERVRTAYQITDLLSGRFSPAGTQPQQAVPASTLTPAFGRKGP